MSEDLSVVRAVADALRRGEASTRAEGIDPDDNPAYLLVKARLLSGELKRNALSSHKQPDSES
jgi:hypothetical protein